MQQLCWRCKNTNDSCAWFKDCTCYPGYVEIKNGWIVKCKHFQEEKFRYNNYKRLTRVEICELLGVNVRTYYRNKEKFQHKLCRLLEERGEYEQYADYKERIKNNSKFK